MQRWWGRARRSQPLPKRFLIPTRLGKDGVGTMEANDGTLEAIILNQAITYAALVQIKPGSCSVPVQQAWTRVGAPQARSRGGASDLHVVTCCWLGGPNLAFWPGCDPPKWGAVSREFSPHVLGEPLSWNPRPVLVSVLTIPRTMMSDLHRLPDIAVHMGRPSHLTQRRVIDNTHSCCFKF